MHNLDAIRGLTQARFDTFMGKLSPEPNTGCWLWTDACFNHGYGAFGVAKQMYTAHRLAYRVLVGEVPNGKELDHLCRVKSCCNPDHLEPVTRSVNVLRGLLPSLTRQQHAARTTCKRGHPFSSDNTLQGSWNHNGKTYLTRVCRICHRTRNQRKPVADGV